MAVIDFGFWKWEIEKFIAVVNFEVGKLRNLFKSE